MMRRITILSLIITLTLFLTLSALALTKEESETAEWKEDILTLLSLVKRVGDYSEVVDLIEVAPALKKDPEIRKAYVDFAPPGVIPPEWAREKKEAPPAVVEVPEKIAIAETAEKLADVAEKKKEEEARRIARQVAAQRKEEEAKIEVPQEDAIIEGPPEKIVTVETTEKVSPEGQAYGAGRWESEQVSREEQRIRPTPLPKGAKIIYSTDVVSGVKAEMVEGKAKVTITLSGERKYKVSERTRPPSIVINIPHTINTVSPRRIMVNRGCVRMIEVTQYRSTPFDEARITVILNRETEYRITHKNNEIYIDFEE